MSECKSCAYFAAAPGECRRRSHPWPDRGPEDWCGEYAFRPPRSYMCHVCYAGGDGYGLQGAACPNDGCDGELDVM
jgi:hypothetical protein